MSDLQTLWAEICASTLPAGLKLTTHKLPFKVYAIVVGGAKGIAIAVPGGQFRVDPIDSHGLTLKKFQEGSEVGAVLLWRSSKLDEFLILLSDLLDAGYYANQDGLRSMSTFVAQVQKWQHFFKQLASGSYFDIKGLFGEIFVLRQMIAGGVDQDQALSAWKIDVERSRVDFIFGNRAVEVEVKTIETGAPAKISSIEQLSTSPATQLFLATVEVTTGSGQTIADLYEGLRSELSSDLLRERLADLMYGYGLPPRTLRSHDEKKFSVKRVLAFSVEGDFPRLQRSHVPKAIESANYQIDIGHIPTENIVHLDDIIRRLKT